MMANQYGISDGAWPASISILSGAMRPCRAPRISRLISRRPGSDEPTRTTVPRGRFLLYHSSAARRVILRRRWARSVTACSRRRHTRSSITGLREAIDCRCARHGDERLPQGVPHVLPGRRGLGRRQLRRRAGGSVPNRPFCWGRNAVFDDALTLAGVKSRLDECRRLAAESGSPSKCDRLWSEEPR